VSTTVASPVTDQPGARRRLAVVTVAYNSADELPGLLDSLAIDRGSEAPFEVFVIDNASTDSSVAIARDHPIGARVVATGRNGGYSAGINVGAALAGPDADLLILNPDTRVRPGAIGLLQERLADPEIGVVVPKLLHEDGTVARSLRREPSVVTAWSDALVGTAIAARLRLGEIVADPDLYAKGGHAEWATGAALLVSSRARQMVGDWDESFFLYSEEVDYLRRVRTAGLRVTYVAEASFSHQGGEYHQNAFLSALMTTNRIRYFRRHHGVLPTLAFRLGLITGSLMRVTRGPGHRAALRAALSP